MTKLKSHLFTPDAVDDGSLTVVDRTSFGTSIAVTRAALRASPLVVFHRSECFVEEMSTRAR